VNAGVVSNPQKTTSRYQIASAAWCLALRDVHSFWRLEVPDGQDTYFGAEADLNLIYPLGKNLTLRALYGQFIPSQRDSFDDHLHYTELEFNASF
jgi:hypothetical protein